MSTLLLLLLLLLLFFFTLFWSFRGLDFGVNLTSKL